MIRSSNLGQIIGELLLRADDDCTIDRSQRGSLISTPKTTPFLRPPQKKRVVAVRGTCKAIRSVLRQHGGKMSCAQIVAAIGNPQITAYKVGTNINHMPDVVKSGEYGDHWYEIAKAAR